MVGLDIIIVHLNSRIGTGTGEPDYVICVINDLDVDLSNWVIIGTHVVYHVYVAVHLKLYTQNMGYILRQQNWF